MIRAFVCSVPNFLRGAPLNQVATNVGRASRLHRSTEATERPRSRERVSRRDARPTLRFMGRKQPPARVRRLQRCLIRRLPAHDSPSPLGRGPG